MLKGIRERLSYANVMSSIAVIVALGTGGAFAASQIDSRDIENGTIRTKDLSFGLAGMGSEAEDSMAVDKSFKTILTRTVKTHHKGNLFVGGEIEATNTAPENVETTTRVVIDGVPDDERFTSTILAGTTDTDPAWFLCNELPAGAHTVNLQVRASGAGVAVGDRTLFNGVLPS
jgi:hypothetical protein